MYDVLIGDKIDEYEMKIRIDQSSGLFFFNFLSCTRKASWR